MKKILVAATLLLLFSCSRKTSVPPAAANPPSVETKPSATTASTADAEGQKIYTSSCGRCHELHRPDEYTAAQWKPIMHRMADKAKLNAEEKLQVMTYLTHQARSVK